MDSELAVLASTAASTIVQLMTTAAWARLKAALAPLFRSSPNGELILDAELEDSHAELTAAGNELERVQTELTAEWQGRFRRLLATDPAIATELRRLLVTELGPALRAAHPDKPNIWMNAVTTGHSRAYQAGGDITITGP
jgi:hypothetical protein